MILKASKNVMLMAMLTTIIVSALAIHSFARIDHIPLYLTLSTGTNIRATTDTSIYSRKITIQNPSTNAATIYVGASTMAGVSTATYVLGVGQAVTLSPSKKEDEQGQQFRVADWYVRGTTGDVSLVIYEKVVNP